jgi:hypothetical protein
VSAAALLACNAAAPDSNRDFKLMLLPMFTPVLHVYSDAREMVFAHVDSFGVTAAVQ